MSAQAETIHIDFDADDGAWTVTFITAVQSENVPFGKARVETQTRAFDNGDPMLATAVDQLRNLLWNDAKGTLR